MRLSSIQLNEINTIFSNLKLKKNDKVHLSIDLVKLHAVLKIKNINFSKFSNLLLRLIQKKIGKNGIIAIPVFNFGCIKSKKFNRNNSPGETGSFGNLLLKKYFKNRTYHPVNSFLIFGRNKIKFINHEHEDCHGADSIWKKFLEYDFKLVTIGHHYVRSFTIVHYLEKLSNVLYRFEKKVHIDYLERNRTIKKKISFFARKLKICKHSTITFECDKIFLKKKIAILCKYKKLISFHLDLNKACKAILSDLKKEKPKLVRHINGSKNKNSVLDLNNVIKLEKKYQNL